MLCLAVHLTPSPLRAEDRPKKPDPAEAARLLTELRGLTTQGRYAAAAALMERTFEVQQGLLGARDPAVTGAFQQLALVYEARGQHAQADALYTRCLALDREVYGPLVLYDIPAARFVPLADYLERKTYEKAEPLVRRYADVTVRFGGCEHPTHAGALFLLADVERLQKRYASAERLLQEALAIRRKALGPDHLLVANTLDMLGRVIEAQGRLPDAETSFRQALDIRQRLLPASDRLCVTTATSLAANCEKQGKINEAEAAFKRALAVTEQAAGAAKLAVVGPLTNLASFYERQEMNKEAEAALKRALAVTEQAVGAGDHSVVGPLRNLASFYERQEMNKEAEALLERALAIREKALGPEHRGLAGNLLSLAAVYDRWGRRAEADALRQRARQIQNRPLTREEHSRRLSSSLLLGRAFRQPYQWQSNQCNRALRIWEDVFGSDHPMFALHLSSLANLEVSQGRLAAAEKLYQRVLSIVEKAYGPGHLQVAACLGNLADVYASQWRRVEEEALRKRAVAIAEKALGPEHPGLPMFTRRLAHQYEAQGRYREAEALCQRGLALTEKALGPDHVRVATALSALAAVHVAQGRHAEAEALYQRALAVAEKELGPADDSAATLLSDLARVYQRQGRYAEAEARQQRALSILEKNLGPEHPKVDVHRRKLADVYESQGRFAEAETLCRRTLAAAENSLAVAPKRVAATLTDLAGRFKRQGRNTEAEALYKRALSLLDEALGTTHPGVSGTLSDLGSLYEVECRFPEAEALLKRAIAIEEQARGPGHPNVAASLHRLARVYRSTGRLADAEAACHRALAIAETAYGADQSFAMTAYLNNLAGLCAQQERYVEAEALTKRVLAIFERTCGSTSRNAAVGRFNLAGIYGHQKRYAEAEPLFKQALAVLEKTTGDRDFLVPACLSSLAVAYVYERRYAEAEPLRQRLLAIADDAHRAPSARAELPSDLNRLASVYVGQRRYAEAEPLCRRAMRLLLLARGSAADDPFAFSRFFAAHYDADLLPCLVLERSGQEDVLQLLEQGRALGLRSLFAAARAETDSDLPDADRMKVRALVARINALGAGLESETEKGRPGTEVRDALQRAEMDYERLLTELRGRHAAFAAAQGAETVTAERAAQLPILDDQTAIVGWVQSRDWTYGYVVRRQGVAWVNLAGATKPSEEGALFGRVSTAEREGARALAPLDLWEVYRRRIAPLEAHLAGVRRLVVIAQGWAAAIPAEMLLTSDPGMGREDYAQWPWLGNRYEISYATSVTALDLLCRRRQTADTRRWERTLVALADPPFSEEQLAQMTREPGGTRLRSQPTTMGLATRPSAAALGGMLRVDQSAAPQRLPGTRLEAQSAASTFAPENVTLLLGPEASERRLFEASTSGELRKYRYVHLATHGLADADRPELSAIVLARAPLDPDYDGLLQMREVLHLRLDADLVVLSGCQTGLGQDIRGEGIVGLATAFFRAGTPSLVVSLWNVSDVSTALLMRRFYANLEKGQTKAAALREAKTWLRNLTRSEVEQLAGREPLLADAARSLGPVQRSEKGERVDDRPFAHPYYWAPVVLIGDAR